MPANLQQIINITVVPLRALKPPGLAYLHLPGPARRMDYHAFQTTNVPTYLQSYAPVNLTNIAEPPKKTIVVYMGFCVKNE
jgi:hypothetical protein